MGQLYQFAPFLVVILFVIFYRKRKKTMEREINRIINESEIQITQDEQQIIIPDKCPHCKNPNTKKIRLCEWCGNQII
jgi:hypothetical protein